MTHKAFIRIPKQFLRTFSLFHFPHNLDQTANTKHIPEPTMRKHPTTTQAFLLVLLYQALRSQAFVTPFGVRISSKKSATRASLEVKVGPDVNVDSEIVPDRILADDEASSTSTAVRAPLKFIGPYPTLALRFPDLQTSSQKERNVTGVSLDFVLDTAANTNTINAQVANELSLEVVGSALPGVGSAGAISGGDTFLLGSSQLEGVGNFSFMEGLTASALPVASPAAAGLLSLAFMNCFEGGVEFDWGANTKLVDGMIENPPSVTFYGEKDDHLSEVLQSMTRVPIDAIPVTQLPSITINVNGIDMPALLDTGSPITVLNQNAAKQAGIETVQVPVAENKKSGNPFAAAANRFKEAQERARLASTGSILTIAGTAGKPVDLLKSTNLATITMTGNKEVSFGDANVYVGEIPGLAALNGLGVQSPPAVVLGMDVLRARPKMLLRARDNEVYF